MTNVRAKLFDYVAKTTFPITFPMPSVHAERESRLVRHSRRKNKHSKPHSVLMSRERTAWISFGNRVSRTRSQHSYHIRNSLRGQNDRHRAESAYEQNVRVLQGPVADMPESPDASVLFGVLMLGRQKKLAWDRLPVFGNARSSRMICCDCLAGVLGWSLTVGYI